CAHTLVAEERGRREERKVVSVLFCDLVGSTARAHAADPEDVSRRLTAYHAAAVWWRSSSAMPLSGFGARRRCTRMTRSELCGPALRSSRRSVLRYGSR